MRFLGSMRFFWVYSVFFWSREVVPFFFFGGGGFGQVRVFFFCLSAFWGSSEGFLFFECFFGVK